MSYPSCPSGYTKLSTSDGNPFCAGMSCTQGGGSQRVVNLYTFCQKDTYPYDYQTPSNTMYIGCC
ncbi:hypothetical protein [Cohnella mopanensis]|uniref:hypothetical protein n=1 Tax=Cohnella mopanensis TaxID=2911966 RepID=UPI001EF91B46|nr:hypothetical protein [Cohnella mopanensis]